MYLSYYSIHLKCKFCLQRKDLSRPKTPQENALTLLGESTRLSLRCDHLKFSTQTTTITSGCYCPSCSGLQHKGSMHSFTAVCFHSWSSWQVPGLSASPKCQGELQLLPEFSRLACLWQLDSDKFCSNILPELYLSALLPLNPKSPWSDDSKYKEQSGLTTLKAKPKLPQSPVCIHRHLDSSKNCWQAGRLLRCARGTHTAGASCSNLKLQKMLWIAVLLPWNF